MKRILLALTAIVALLSCTVASAAQTRLLFNVFTGQNQFMWGVMHRWAKEVAKATDGRVTVQFPSTSAAPAPAQWNAVRGGIVDGAFIYDGFAPPAQKTLQNVSQLPWVTNGNTEAASVALWRTYDKFFKAKEQAPSVQIISVFQFGGGQLYSVTDTPIRHKSDLTDRKLWALPGTSAGVLKAMGVSFVSGPAARIQEFLSNHVVDGALGISMSSMVRFQGAPYVKSVTLFPHPVSAASFTAFINKSKWMSISKADRTAIMKVSGEHLARLVGQAADQARDQAVTTMKKNGIQFLKADAQFTATMEKAGSGLIKTWIAQADKMGVNGQQALDYYQSQVKALSADGH